MSYIKNKVIIITGASSGIGMKSAYNLAAAGAKVTLVARRKQKLDNIVLDLTNLGLLAFAIEADLENETDIISIFEQSHQYWGKTDVLINNAGYCTASNFHTGDTDEWQKMWAVNVLAPCIAIRESLKYFDQELGGYIINISSTSSYRITNPGSFYAATKFALRAVSESLRKELVEKSSKTRVSCISPSFVATSFGRSAESNNLNNSNKAMLDTDDISNAIIYLLQTPPHVSVQDIILRSVNQYE